MADVIATHAELSRQGVDHFYPAYKEKQPRLYKKYGLTHINTTKEYERMYQEGDFPLPSEVGEGTAIPIVSFMTGNNKDYYWVKRALGWRATYEKLQTDQYGITKKASKKMARSMENGKEATFIALINNMTSTGAQFVGPDGVALVSASHGINGSTSNNRGIDSSATDADLSIAALEGMLSVAETILSEEGNPMMDMGPFKLWCHPNNHALAWRLINTMNGGQPQTNDNDKSYAGRLVTDVISNPWQTDTDAWGLVNTSENGLIHLTHGTQLTEDERNKQYQHVSFYTSEKWLFHYFDWRGFYGTVGA